MKTQRQSALAGIITEEMKEVARQEGLSAETIRERVAKGTIAICANINHKNLKVRGVGEGLSTKVNANIGTSTAYPDPAPELKNWMRPLQLVPMRSWTFQRATTSTPPAVPLSSIRRSWSAPFPFINHGYGNPKPWQSDGYDERRHL